MSLPRRPSVVLADGALAAFFVVLSQLELHQHFDDGYQAGPLWLNVPLVALMSAPLVVRRIAPRACLATMLAGAALPGLFVAHTIFFWGSLVPMAVATYSVARHRADRSGRLAWLAGPVILLSNMGHMPELRTGSNAVFGLGVFGLAWLVGRVLRRVSVQSAQLAEALGRVAAHQAEREEAAVASERRRIAAELHDVISHSVSLMTIQTGAARLSLEADDRPVPPQLRAAEETGRAALVELRRVLGLLRDETGDAATLQPLPNLAAVPELVAQVREAGLDVELVQQVDREVPASLQLTAYRLLQEAFTNVLKHAGPVQVRAVVCTSPEGLTVSVVNRPGAADPLPTGGHGVDGMRQRVTVFGGTLSVGPRPDRGYEVSAVLPIPTAELEAAW